ncbi:MAG: DUF951 domain-containing protein [Selenomonadaceae bacterium]|nr:DUF951 domain-containing protein [Selenomonadaceae bacterium]
MEKIHYDVGDIVRMKKPHPCGSHEWQITRTGMDFGMRCRGCGHFVMLPRPKFEKMVRAIVEKAEAHENKEDNKGLSS